MEYAHIKKQLYEACELAIDKRIALLQGTIISLHADLANETKSSAGDKFETGRAMLHLEIKKSEDQLWAAQNEKTQLNDIAYKHAFKASADQVSIGSLVITAANRYFIGSGLGKVVITGVPYYACSPSSPISSLMLGKHKGESYMLNNKTHEILDIH